MEFIILILLALLAPFIRLYIRRQREKRFIEEQKQAFIDAMMELDERKKGE